MARSASDSFIPRWRKNKQGCTSNACEIPACKNVVSKSTMLRKKAEIVTLLCVTHESEDTCYSSNENQTELCESHYRKLYDIINPKKKCVACDKSLSSKFRKCPNPELVQTFLRENIHFDGKILPGDDVCEVCYREHLLIIKHKQNTTVISTDIDLNSILNGITLQLSDTTTINSLEEALSHAARFTALHVGNALLKQTALLLPDMYEYFVEKVRATTDKHKICCSNDLLSVASSNWLRSQLSGYLQHHLAYKCTSKRYGTLLYHTGGDLIHALSVALAQNRSKTNQTHIQRDNTHTQLNSTVSICSELNKRVHTCIDKLIQEDSHSPHKIENLDIDKFINEIDLTLWAAVCTLTQTRSPQAIKRANTSTIRKVRRFFLTCTILYTTNQICSFPLHTFLTDAIETCGGSLRLIRLLNHLGACASIDTHNRYVQHRVAERIRSGHLNSSPPIPFTITSIDN